ncbi:MAG: hypothetical protein FD120_2828, partial [Gammaproteobacteria bacterium]
VRVQLQAAPVEPAGRPTPRAVDRAGRARRRGRKRAADGSDRAILSEKGLKRKRSTEDEQRSQLRSGEVRPLAHHERRPSHAALGRPIALKRRKIAQLQWELAEAMEKDRVWTEKFPTVLARRARDLARVTVEPITSGTRMEPIGIDEIEDREARWTAALQQGLAVAVGRRAPLTRTSIRSRTSSGPHRRPRH